MSIEITESELLAELRREFAVDDVPPDARTVAELCAEFNVGTNAIARRLAKYRAQGRLKEYRTVRCDDQGRRRPCRAYVLLPAQPETPKRKR